MMAGGHGHEGTARVPKLVCLLCLSVTVRPSSALSKFQQQALDTYNPNPRLLARNTSSVDIEYGTGNKRFHLKDVYEWHPRGQHQTDLTCMILEVAGVPYRATLYTGHGFHAEYKKIAPFGRVPVLEVEAADGGKMMLGQTKAILQYVAKYAGLAGTTVEDHARTLMMYELYSELFAGQGGWDAAGTLRSSGQAQYTLKESLGNTPLSPFQKSAMGLRTFESILNKTGRFVTGPKLSYVDLALMMWISNLEVAFPQWDVALALPELRRVFDEVSAMDSILEYDRSGRRMPIVSMHPSYHFMSREELSALV